MSLSLGASLAPAGRGGTDTVTVVDLEPDCPGGPE